ncbi:MAG: general secretion pathway protein GspK [Nevskiaceae bacterium]|nr:MAG: general secretion pathway protein GspK [Nevskiaceae bacterium]TBR74828.1 MAG: general secretion pathway protein GspK [Nevskiaceae bacterium]
MIRPLPRQRGVALITAIFVVALATIVATALVSATGMALQRMQNLRDSEAAWWYAFGLEDWVAGLLQRRPGQPAVDYLGEQWAQPVTNLPYDRGTVSGHLIDLQGRFNLNNLAATGNDLEYYERQFRLLLASIPDFPQGGDTLNLGQRIHVWLTPAAPGIPPPDAAQYLSLTPPYMPAGQEFLSPSGLLAVAGVTPQIYDALAPYIAALPEVGTKINVNTAPLPVLLSLAMDVNANRLSSFAATRTKEPAPTVQALYGTQLNLLPADVPQTRVDVQTSYFQLQGYIAVGSAKLNLYSSIRRQAGGAPVVYARSTGAE